MGLANNLPLWQEGMLTPNIVIPFLGVLPSDFTFSRSSSATRWNEEGKLVWADENLIRYSQDIGNSVGTSWASYNVSYFTSNAGVAPDGTQTACSITPSATMGGRYFNSGVSVIAGFQYTTSAYFKRVSGGTTLQLGVANQDVFGDAAGDRYFQFNGTTGAFIAKSAEVSAYDIEELPDGWFRVSGTFTPTVSAPLKPSLYGESGVTFYAWGAQVEHTSYDSPQTYRATTSAAYYGPRFEYNPATGELKGLLLEEQSTNSFLHSGDLTNAAWTLSAVTRETSSELAPDGTSYYTKLTATAAFASASQFQAVAEGEYWTASYYVKKGSSSLVTIVQEGTGAKATFNLDEGVITLGTGDLYYNSSIEQISADEYRISLTLLINDTVTTIAPRIWLGEYGPANLTGEYMYVWGAQLENGRTASSYIPTTSAAATRAADNLYTTNLPWFNADKGTMLIEASLKDVSRYYQLASFDNGTIAERVSLASNVGHVRGAIYAGGVASVNYLEQMGLEIVKNTVFKAALAWSDETDIATIAEGGESHAGNGSGSTGTFVTPDVSRLVLFNRSGSAAYASGHIKSFKYWNRRLSDIELQRITS